MAHTLIIDGSSLEHVHRLTDVYKLRHKVFCDTKGWVATNPERKEIDTYDYLSPVHFIHINASNNVDGCCRILPTTGPNMLKDIFPELMGSTPVPEHATMWEISRFAIDKEQSDLGFASISEATSELLITLFKYAFDNNIKKIVAVTDIAFERVLRRAGLYTSRYSEPHKYDNCEAVAGYADVNHETIALLEERLIKNNKRNFKSYEKDGVYTDNVPQPQNHEEINRAKQPA